MDAIYKNYSLDTVKYNDETVWYKITFTGAELDLSSNRLVLIFDKQFWTNSIPKLISNNFKMSSHFYTASTDLQMDDNFKYIDKSEVSRSEYDVFVDALLGVGNSKEAISKIIDTLNNNGEFI